MAIADIVGVPMEDRGKLFTWTNQVLGSNDPEFQTERGPEAYEVSTGMVSLFLYSRELANKAAGRAGR
jgi:cholest-4-en-3-one 26-monooxygenase